MLASWTKLLPYFIVAWLAQKHCMRLAVGGLIYCEAYDDALIMTNESRKKRDAEWARKIEP